MFKSYKDVVEAILGVLIFCAVLFVAEKSGIRQNSILPEALLSKGIGSASRLSPKENFYDFGRVSMGSGVKSHSFELVNTGKDDIVIEKVYTTCPCLEVFILKENSSSGPFSFRDYLNSRREAIVIKEGEKFTAKLVYSPALQGPFGVGLSEPFAVLQDRFGNRTRIRISALVFP